MIHKKTTFIISCLLGGLFIHGAYARLYDQSVCRTGTCATDNLFWDTSCVCDDYYVMGPERQTCTTDRDCSYNGYQGVDSYKDSAEMLEARCYNGYCARELREGECEESFQFLGDNYQSQGLWKGACYLCPAYATCDGNNVMCNNGRILNRSTANIFSAICSTCPSHTTSYASYSASSKGDRSAKSDCYIASTTTIKDEAGTYHFNSDCSYTE